MLIARIYWIFWAHKTNILYSTVEVNGMNTNFTLEDIINALKLVGDDGRADELAAEILGVSTDKLWEIEDNFEA